MAPRAYSGHRSGYCLPAQRDLRPMAEPKTSSDCSFPHPVYNGYKGGRWRRWKFFSGDGNRQKLYADKGIYLWARWPERCWGAMSDGSTLSITFTFTSVSKWMWTPGSQGSSTRIKWWQGPFWISTSPFSSSLPLVKLIPWHESFVREKREKSSRKKCVKRF